MSTLSKFGIRTALLASTLIVTLGSSALHAQWAAPRSRVNVPFAFQVGSTHFAAGTYTLGNSDDALLFVQGESTSALVLSSHEITSKPAHLGKVVFSRYGNKYYLREIWTQDSTDYIVCPESKAETSARREMRQVDRASVATPTNVEVALLQSPR